MGRILFSLIVSIFILSTSCKTTSSNIASEPLRNENSLSKCQSKMYKVKCLDGRVEYRSEYDVNTHNACHNLFLIPQKSTVFRSLTKDGHKSACVVDPNRITSLKLAAAEPGKITRSVLLEEAIPYCSGRKFEVLVKENRILLDRQELSANESYPSKKRLKIGRNIKVECLESAQNTRSKVRSMSQPQEDVTPPELLSLRIEPSDIKRGMKGQLIFEATDNLSGIDHSICQQFKNGYGVIPVCGDFRSLGDNKFSIGFEVNEYIKSGEYKLYQFTINDKAGNVLNYVSKINDTKYPTTDIEVPTFKIDSPTPDTTPPVLSDVEIVQSTVQAGSNMQIIVTASDDLSGLRTDLFYATLMGPRFDTYNLSGEMKEIGTNKYSIDVKIQELVEAGTYNLESLTLFDKASNQSYYHADIFTGNGPYVGTSVAIPSVDIQRRPSTNIYPLKPLSIDPRSIKYGSSGRITVEAFEDISQYMDICVNFESVYLPSNEIRHSFQSCTQLNQTTGNIYSANFTVEESISSFMKIAGIYRVSEIAALNGFYPITLWRRESGDLDSGPKPLTISISNHNKVDLVDVKPSTLKSGSIGTLTIKANEDISDIGQVCVTFASQKLAFLTCGSLEKTSDGQYKVEFRVENDPDIGYGDGSTVVEPGSYQILNVMDKFRGFVWQQKGGAKPEPSFQSSIIEVVK